MATQLWSEVRTAIRGLGRAPTVTAAAVACIALGIGSTTAIYAAVHAALVRPLPFPAPERLVSVFRTTPHFDSGPFAPGNFLDLRGAVASIESLAAVSTGVGLLEGDDESVRVSVNEVSGEFFRVAGVSPVVGRLPGPADEDPGRVAAAALSEELWRDRYGADPGVIGSTIRLEGEEHEVVGVVRRGFAFPHGGRVLTADVWTTLRITPEQASSRRSNYLLVVGRLAPGVTAERAHEELRTAMAGIVDAHPELRGEQLRVVPLRSAAVEAVRAPLLLLLGAVAFVLLIAAANVASLLLARGVGRSREWAIRSAVGARGGDVVRIALLDSLLVTAAGSALGIGLAWLGVRAIERILPSSLPQLASLSIEPAILLVALALAITVGVAAGVAPAWQAGGAEPQRALGSGLRAGAGHGHHRFLRSLVAAEVALSLVLLLGAGLVIRGFQQLVSQDPGFETHDLLTLEVNLPSGDYVDRSTVDAFLTPALEAVRAVPGIEHAGTISLIPYQSWGWNFNIRYEGQPAEDPTRLPLVENRFVSPDFFATLDMTLLGGRLLEPQDDADAPPVVVANRALAERDFPDDDPVGKRFHLGDTTFATIVGVVENIRNFGPDRPPQPEVYWTVAQRGGGTSFPLMVRVTGEPAPFASAVAGALRSVDPAVAISQVRPMDEVIAGSVGRPRFYLALLTVFAAVALLLAMAGLYGLMSYVVAQRTREIGIRSALGSTTRSTVGLVMRGGLGLVAIGAVFGIGGGLAITRLLEGLLYGISPLDPLIWIAVPLLLAAAGIIAILVPAVRAAGVDPVVAIRTE